MTFLAGEIVICRVMLTCNMCANFRALGILVVFMLAGANTVPAGGGPGFPDLTTQMRQQSQQASQRFREAARSGQRVRQQLRAQRRMRERTFREKRKARRKKLEQSGLFAPGQ